MKRISAKIKYPMRKICIFLRIIDKKITQPEDAAALWMKGIHGIRILTGHLMNGYGDDLVCAILYK